MAYEQPRYTVLERHGNFEVRRYEPYIVAEVEVCGSLEDAGNKAFRPLADFIFGKNRRSEAMSMTAPVTQTVKGETIGMTAPVIQSATGEQTYVVSFVMPSRYTMGLAAAAGRSDHPLSRHSGIDGRCVDLPRHVERVAIPKRGTCAA